MRDRGALPNRIQIEPRRREDTKRALKFESAATNLSISKRILYQLPTSTNGPIQKGVFRVFVLSWVPSWFKYSLPAAWLFITLSGCGNPNKANIELRKQNQQLQAKVESLHRQVETSKAEIAGLREKEGSLPSLPSDRLEKLFTTSSVRLGKLTGGADLDPAKPGEEGLKVYLTPYDQNGDKIKSAGSFEIDAFDLDAPDPAMRLGHWLFNPAEAGKHWISFLTEYNYALPLSWQDRRPSRDRVTIRVTFTDELTGRKFTEQVVGKVILPKISGDEAK